MLMTNTSQSEIPNTQVWSSVGSMALCVALLIASEFMPVSLLTPIAHDLHATEGLAGQAISFSGLFAVVTSVLIASWPRLMCSLRGRMQPEGRWE